MNQLNKSLTCLSLKNTSQLTKTMKNEMETTDLRDFIEV